jgi:cardiolipin synthase A/B
VYGPAARLRLLLLLLALLAASCAPGRTSPAALGPVGLPGGAGGLIRSGADRLLPLTDGPSAFAAIAGQLKSARRSIELELYEFQRNDLATMVLDARHRGAAVAAIKDPSEKSSRSIWAQLEQAGVRVVAFPVERLSIDHVKLLIVDGERAIVGGINWGTHSIYNHDVDVLAAGPVVKNLQRVFQQDLALAGVPAVIPSPTADSQVQVLVTRPGDSIRAAVLAAIAAARSSIDLEMFVLSDRLVLDALSAAARRGVRLRVLLEPTQPQNGVARTALAAVGATVRYYVPAGDELLHAKVGIFDAAVVLFGSCNWSRSGFTTNHELDLLVREPALAKAFTDRLEQDWTMSGG